MNESVIWINLFNKRLNDSLKTVTCHHLLLVLVSCLKNHFKQKQHFFYWKETAKAVKAPKKIKIKIIYKLKIYKKIYFLSISHHHTPLSWLIPIYEWEKQTLQPATNQSKALERKKKKMPWVTGCLIGCLQPSFIPFRCIQGDAVKYRALWNLFYFFLK